MTTMKELGSVAIYFSEGSDDLCTHMYHLRLMEGIVLKHVSYYTTLPLSMSRSMLEGDVLQFYLHTDCVK